MKGTEKRFVKKQKKQSRRVVAFFTLSVVAIILVTIAIVWAFGILLTSSGINILKELRVSSSFYVWAVLAASSIIGAALSVIFGRLVLRPFQDLIKGMMSLSRGDYSVRLKARRIGRYEILHDITDGFNDMAAELENTELLRGDFINNFSHEFKTPIASISGLLDLLKKENLPEKKRLEYIAVIEEETDRLLQMSSNVLNLTKVENETVLKNVEEYNLSEQIRGCILLLEKKWERKNLRLLLDFDEYTVEASADLLKHVWMNLLDNAVKFANEDGEIAVKINGSDGKIAVRVENTGSYISDEDMQKIFNKFYQADMTHTREGNGIGLSIAKRIVELHGGEIFAESADGRVAFTVILPINAA